MSVPFYLHGSLLGEGDHKVLPLPVLFHHMGKDDMPVATGPSQLGAICRPGQGEHTACVGLLQCVGPLDQARREQRRRAGRERTIRLMPTDLYLLYLKQLPMGRLWN